MFGLGMMEIAILAAVLVVIFGPSRIPKLARAVGQSVIELRRGLSEEPQLLESHNNNQA